MGKHEQWDEEWREVGRSHGWELPPPAMAAAFGVSGTCERPWPPCNSYDEKSTRASLDYFRTGRGMGSGR